MDLTAMRLTCGQLWRRESGEESREPLEDPVYIRSCQVSELA